MKQKPDAIPILMLLFLVISNYLCFYGLKTFSNPLRIGVQLMIGIIGFFLYKELAKRFKEKYMKYCLFGALVLMISSQIFLIING